MKLTRKSATAFAPATVGNVAVGFDLLGLCFPALGDTVTVSVSESTALTVSCSLDRIPLDPLRNTAAVAVEAFRKKLGFVNGFHIDIKKEIPLGSGLGGSAASAVGAVVAANALLQKPLPMSDLLPFALEGEAVASGGKHADNIAPCLMGGLQLVTTEVPFEMVLIPTPTTLCCAVAHPDIEVETRTARGILKKEVSLSLAVRQSGHLARFITACHQGDLKLLKRAFVDELIEPQRKSLIPAFDEVKKAALRAGALGCSISGSGPSVFALADSIVKADKAAKAMQAAFSAAKLNSQSWALGLPGAGAKVIA